MKTFAALFLLIFLSPCARAQFTQGDAIKATTTMHADGSYSTLVVDPEKQSAEQTEFTSGGKVTGRIVYPLDPQNQPIGAITYDVRGAVIAKSSYKRDDSGRISEETITSAGGQFLRRRVYSYASGSKISRIDEYDESGVLIPRAPGAATSGKPQTQPKKRR